MQPLVLKSSAPCTSEGADLSKSFKHLPAGSSKICQAAAITPRDLFSSSQVLETGSRQSLLHRSQRLGHGRARRLGGVQAPNGTAVVMSCLRGGKSPQRLGVCCGNLQFHIVRNRAASRTGSLTPCPFFCSSTTSAVIIAILTWLWL